MKKTGVTLVVAVLLAVFVFSAGCTSSPPPHVTPAVTVSEGPAEALTPAPEAEITVEISQETTEEIPVVTPAATQDLPDTATSPAPATPSFRPTASAEPDPVDVSQIVFLRYTDGDFTLDYPSTWKIEHSSYVSYICTSTATVRCYQTEVKEIGPFDFNEYSFLRKPTRIVTFTSPDKKQKFISFVTDFKEGMSGNFQLDPTLEWCKERVGANYPDVSGSAVGDYQYSSSGNTMTSIHTVMTPTGSAAYPLAYTMKNYVTTHRYYEFVFISNIENIQKYRNLKDRMISSINPTD